MMACCKTAIPDRGILGRAEGKETNKAQAPLACGMMHDGQAIQVLS